MWYIILPYIQSKNRFPVYVYTCMYTHILQCMYIARHAYSNSESNSAYTMEPYLRPPMSWDHLVLVKQKVHTGDFWFGIKAGTELRPVWLWPCSPVQATKEDFLLLKMVVFWSLIFAPFIDTYCLLQPCTTCDWIYYCVSSCKSVYLGEL